MIERLTDRERQILDLAAQHLTSKQIGPLLGIGPASVDTFMLARTACDFCSHVSADFNADRSADRSANGWECYLKIKSKIKHLE